MIAAAIPLILSAGLSQAGGEPTVTACERAMRRRDVAFRPLAEEMRALLAADRRPGDGARGYPALRLNGRYPDLDRKMRAFDRRHPYRDCSKEKSDSRR